MAPCVAFHLHPTNWAPQCLCRDTTEKMALFAAFHLPPSTCFLAIYSYSTDVPLSVGHGRHPMCLLTMACATLRMFPYALFMHSHSGGLLATTMFPFPGSLSSGCRRFERPVSQCVRSPSGSGAPLGRAQPTSAVQRCPHPFGGTLGISAKGVLGMSVAEARLSLFSFERL